MNDVVTDNPRLSADVQFEIIEEAEVAPPAAQEPDVAPAPPGHETPAVKKPLAKGVFDRDQQGLTLAQRTRFNQLVQSGIDPKVARQLAVVLAKSTSKPLGAAYARARRLKEEKGGDEKDTRRRVHEYLRQRGHAGVAKGGPGSGPRPGGGKKIITNGEIKALEAQVPMRESMALGFASSKLVDQSPKGTAEQHAKHAEIHDKLVRAHEAIGNTRGQDRHKERAAFHRDAAAKLKSVKKGGPGSGPQPGGGLHDKVLRQLKDTAREAREAGDHKRADALQSKAAALAARTLARLKKAQWDENDHPRDEAGKFSAGASAAGEKHAELQGQGLKGKALAKAHTELARKATAAADLVGDDDKKKSAFFAEKAAEHTRLAAAAGGKPAGGAKPAAVPKAVADGLLTPEQHGAMQAYAAQTGVRSGYEDINDALAGTLPAHLGAERIEAARQNARLLNEAIAASPAPKAITLYRGSTLPVGMKVGDVLDTPRLVSTSKDPKVAKAFAELGSGPGAHVGILEIAVAKGTPVLDVNKVGGSKIRGEKEHLLASNQKIYITGVDTSGPIPRYTASTTPPEIKKATTLAARTLAGVRKSYAAEFVAGAKQALPRTYFNQLHDGARARAGGRASGMSRRAAGDEERGALMARRSALRAELATLEAQLQKSGPVAQEVAVDAPVVLSPKEAKRRKRLSEQLVDRALEAVKSAPPPGSERVKVEVAARVVKAAQPAWKRIVHSVVYSPGDVDAHGDYMDPEDIEKMAHDAMRSGLYVNHEHQAGAIEADIVESYIAPQDFNLQLDDGSPYHIPKGSHVMAMHVWGDEPWQRVLSGEYAGFSLEGTALREVA